MKNAIKYYYNLDVDSICQKNDAYYLIIDNNMYYLLKYNETDINKIYELSKNITWSHEIISNSNKMLITNINNVNYVLLRLKCINRQIIESDILDISNIPYQKNNDNSINWVILWENKVDYFEYQISQLSNRYPILMKSFNYYIGLTETAIQFLKMSNINVPYLYIQHKRIRNTDSLIDLYNPINFILDCKIRDMCEYFKSKFFNSNINEYDLYNYIDSLMINDKILFMARMLYPSFYFDLYEDIIQYKVQENSLNNIISKVKDYELLLKKIYLYIKKEVNMVTIEWLIKT